MNVEIITIGDELLIGQVIDSNSAWMGLELNSAGFDVVRKSTISDNKNQIIKTLEESLKRVDIVLLTGGLGPTKDDITKATLCDFFQTELIFNKDVYNDVKSYLSSEGQEILESNKDQALIPRDCQIIRNSVGTAPIMWFERGNKIVVSMPGVPLEMKTVMKNSIIPKLTNLFAITQIIHKTVIINNMPEADIANKIVDIENSLPTYISLSYLPSPSKVRLRLTGKGHPQDIMSKELDDIICKIKNIIGDSLWAIQDILPEVLLGDILKKSKLKLSCAESCTGGNIAHLITKIPGSSEYFNGGVVAYHNNIKENVLGVSIDDLKSFGAVSKSVVEQMAIGVKKLMNTDWAVATSGIAGPTGGSVEKPVGTVWIAWAGPHGVESKRFQFGKLREQNIIGATESALVGLISRIKLD